MEKNVNRVCYTCGGTSFIKINSRTLKCEYCGNVIENNDSLSSEVITFLNQGDACRRKIDFENAEEYYSLAKEKDVTCAEAYFGLLMCEYGVTHVKDPVTEIMKPTLNRLSETPIKESLFYKKLFECLFDNESKKIYQKKCDELEEIRKKSLEISKSKKGYDIFISFKKTPFETGNGDYTKDYVEAKELYNKLNNDHRFKGKVFFSEETLKDYAGEDYEPVIYNALKTSKLMFVFSSKKEYGNAGWVKNEWTRFLKMKTQDTSKVLIPIILNTIEDLPEPLQKIQGIFCDKNYNENINKKVNEVFKNGTSSFGKGEKIVELNVTKHIDIDKIEEGNGFSGVGVDISTSEKALYDQIVASLTIGKFKEAESICNVLLEKNPDNPYALWEKVNCFCKSKNDNELIKHFFVYCPELEKLQKIFSNVSKENGSKYLYLIVDAINNVLKNNIDFKVDYFDSIVSFCYSYLTKDQEALANINDKFFDYINNYLQGRYFTKRVYSNAELIKIGNLILKNPVISSSEDLFSRVACTIGFTFAAYANKKNQSFFALAKAFFEKAINANPTLYEAVFYYHLMSKETHKETMYENINEKNYEEYAGILKDLLERKYKIPTEKGIYLEPNENNKLESCIYYYFHETVCQLLLHNKINVAKLFFKQYITYSYFKTNEQILYVNELRFFASMLLTYNDFKEAKEYYNEIISCNNNDYTAFMGLLNCEFKCNSCLDLLVSKNKIGESKNYLSALTVASSVNQSAYIQTFYMMNSSLKGKAKKALVELNKICKKYHLVISFEKLVIKKFTPDLSQYYSLEYKSFYYICTARLAKDTIFSEVWKDNFSIKKNYNFFVIKMFFICSLLLMFSTPIFERKHDIFVQIWIPLLILIILANINTKISINVHKKLYDKINNITSYRTKLKNTKLILGVISHVGIYVGTYLLMGFYYPLFSEYIEINNFLFRFGYYLISILLILIMTLFVGKIGSLFFLRKKEMSIINKEKYDDCFNYKKKVIVTKNFNINKTFNEENYSIYKKANTKCLFINLFEIIINIAILLPIMYFAIEPVQKGLNYLLNYDNSAINIMDYKENLSNAENNYFIKTDGNGKKYILIDDNVICNSIGIIGNKNKIYDFYLRIERTKDVEINLYNVNINYKGNNSCLFYNTYPDKCKINFVCNNTSFTTTNLFYGTDNTSKIGNTILGEGNISFTNCKKTTIISYGLFCNSYLTFKNSQIDLIAKNEDLSNNYLIYCKGLNVNNSSLNIKANCNINGLIYADEFVSIKDSDLINLEYSKLEKHNSNVNYINNNEVLIETRNENYCINTNELLIENSNNIKIKTNNNIFSNGICAKSIKLKNIKNMEIEENGKNGIGINGYENINIKNANINFKNVEFKGMFSKNIIINNSTLINDKSNDALIDSTDINITESKINFTSENYCITSTNLEVENSDINLQSNNSMALNIHTQFNIKKSSLFINGGVKNDEDNLIKINTLNADNSTIKIKGGEANCSNNTSTVSIQNLSLINNSNMEIIGANGNEVYNGEIALEITNSLNVNSSTLIVQGGKGAEGGIGLYITKYNGITFENSKIKLIGGDSLVSSTGGKASNYDYNEDIECIDGKGAN